MRGVRWFVFILLLRHQSRVEQSRRRMARVGGLGNVVVWSCVLEEAGSVAAGDGLHDHREDEVGLKHESTRQHNRYQATDVPERR